MRHFLQLLILIVSGLLMVADVAAQEQEISAWWYPLGNPEGTRRNSDPTASQQNSDLVIKWRTPQLHGAPTILVGGIGSVGAQRQQQVVGTMIDTLLIVSDRGLVQQKRSIASQAITGEFNLTLTGLFNLGSPTPSVNAVGLPTRIGLGIERSQRTTPGTPDPFPLLAFLADSTGTLRERIVIEALPDDPDLNNQRAGVYPVAAYNSTVLVAVSQNSYSGTGSDTLANSIRKYDVAGPALLRWSYPVASRTYAQHPTLLADPLQPEIQRIGLSTSSYPHDTHIELTPPSGRSTFTDSMYSVQILDSVVPAPAHFHTHSVPLTPPPAGLQGEAHSYFVTLSESPGSENNFLLITKNHSPSRPGSPRIWLVTGTPDDAGNRGEIYAEFSPTRLARTDVGLTVVTANIDGNAPGRTIPDEGFSYYVNNPDAEIIIAYNDPTGAPMAENYIYGIRRRLIDAQARRLDPFMQYPFRGRLMGAGDLVKDPDSREELVIADRNVISILQLKSYDSEDFNRAPDPIRTFFQVLRSDTLDADIISIAIADLEGDRENDLIVTTKNSTYAIGKPVFRPFGTIQAELPSYCPGTDVKVRWNRSVGGGQDGLRLVLLRGNEVVTTLAESHLPASSRGPSNPGEGPDTFTIAKEHLTPGSYRLRIEDPTVASLNDIGEPFVITQPEITGFRADPGGTDPAFNDPVTLTATVACAESLLVQRSYNGSDWETIDAEATVTGESASAMASLACPAESTCGGTDSTEIFFRFIDTAGGVISGAGSVKVPIPVHPLQQSDRTGEPTGKGRERTIRWNPADYGCDTLIVSLVDSEGVPVVIENNIAAASGELPIRVPGTLSDSLRVRICCASGTGTSCGYGISSVFEIPELPAGNYVAPNPFNPHLPGVDGNGAVIVYHLEKAAPVSITIYDASRAVVRRLAAGELKEANRWVQDWDGRNSLGDIVGAGTYICIVERGDEQPIVLPIIVTKR